MNKPLTEGQIQAIRERSVGTELAYDFAALDGEITRLADALTDCWLLLDSFATHKEKRYRLCSETLLRRQKAPGWRD